MRYTEANQGLGYVCKQNNRPYQRCRVYKGSTHLHLIGQDVCWNCHEVECLGFAKINKSSSRMLAEIIENAEDTVLEGMPHDIHCCCHNCAEYASQTYELENLIRELSRFLKSVEVTA